MMRLTPRMDGGARLARTIVCLLGLNKCQSPMCVCVWTHLQYAILTVRPDR